MRLWLNRNGEVPLREQLMTQVVLGILCRELAPGDRLPSTRELARRFGIHANTASAAYRELERAGWVEQKHGKGVFVRRSRPEMPADPEAAVDRLVGELTARARRVGATEDLLKARLRRWLALEPPARWLVIEPDPELRRVLCHEMEAALALPVSSCAPAEAAGLLERALPVVLPSKAEAVRRLLPASTELTVIEVQPVSGELAQKLERYLPEHAADLVGLASRWSDFLRIGQTLLMAVGLRAESLLVCDAARPGWKRGLEATVAVVCDAATADELPRGCFPLVFELLGAPMLKRLREREEQAMGKNPHCDT